MIVGHGSIEVKVIDDAVRCAHRYLTPLFMSIDDVAMQLRIVFHLGEKGLNDLNACKSTWPQRGDSASVATR